MATVAKESLAGGTRFMLAGRPLANGDEVELRLHGNDGWTPVRIEGLPARLRIRWQADDGHEVHTTLPLDADLRWP